MGLFDKLKKEKVQVDWSGAYKVTPQFYSKPDGSSFGAIALTEGTETVLPKAPQCEYTIDGKQVASWKLVLVSTTTDSVIGACDYFCALEKLGKYSLDSHDKSILIKALTLEEIESILK